MMQTTTTEQRRAVADAVDCCISKQAFTHVVEQQEYMIAHQNQNTNENADTLLARMNAGVVGVGTIREVDGTQ